MKRAAIFRDLIRVARRVGAEGLVIGASGNISVRRGKTMLIKASGAWLEQATAADFVAIPLADAPAGGRGKRPSCEYRMHAACYLARPDITCVIHTHPLYATLLVTCGLTVRAISPEFSLSIGSEPGFVRYLCPGTAGLAHSVGKCAAEHNVVYMKNHGLVAVGASLDEAYMRTQLAEQLAKMHIIAALLKRRLPAIDSDELRCRMARS